MSGPGGWPVVAYATAVTRLTADAAPGVKGDTFPHLSSDSDVIASISATITSGGHGENPIRWT